jgi:hypothetical protein
MHLAVMISLIAVRNMMIVMQVKIINVIKASNNVMMSFLNA